MRGRVAAEFGVFRSLFPVQAGQTRFITRLRTREAFPNIIVA